MSEQRRLPPGLRAELDAEPARALVEYLAERLGADDGLYRLEFQLENGHLRRSWLNRGPIGSLELDWLRHP